MSLHNLINLFEERKFILILQELARIARIKKRICSLNECSASTVVETSWERNLTKSLKLSRCCVETKFTYPCKTWESVHQSGLSDTVTIIHLKTRFAYRLFAKRKKKRKEQKTEREKERGVRNLFLSNESRLLLEIYYRSLVTMNSFVAGSIERQSRDLPSKETASYNHVSFH